MSAAPTVMVGPNSSAKTLSRKICRIMAMAFSLEVNTSIVDLASRLPVYFRSDLRIKLRRRNDSIDLGVACSILDGELCVRPIPDPSNVRLRRDLGTACGAVDRPRCRFVREKWLARRCYLYPQRLDHGANFGVRRYPN